MLYICSHPHEEHDVLTLPGPTIMQQMHSCNTAQQKLHRGGQKWNDIVDAIEEEVRQTRRQKIFNVFVEFPKENNQILTQMYRL